jgi:hypothetical protein
LYEESRQLVRKLVRRHTHDRPDGGYKGGDGLLTRFARKLKELFIGPIMKKKDIETILTKRCGMPREAAVKLAKQVRQDLRR